MNDYEANIKKIESLIYKMGETNFANALKEIKRREDIERKATCTHNWKLSQIAGNGYKCFKCGSWKAED